MTDEDKKDLIEAKKILEKIRNGEEKTIAWEDAKKILGIK